MPVFKKSNTFSQNFNKKTPFRNEELIELPKKSASKLPVSEPELEKATKWEDTEMGQKQKKKADKKTKRKETWGKVKSKADEIGMELLNRPIQSDPYL